MIKRLTAIFVACLFNNAYGFVPKQVSKNSSSPVILKSSMTAELVEPSQRDKRYGQNVAKYLVDLHDSKATFDFCGGMMFQLVLSDKLRNHLLNVANDDKDTKQPIIYDSSKTRMSKIPNYEQSAFADNHHIFHGREIRQVPDAAGGMGMVLHLSLANYTTDPEGWTPQEIAGYDGWGHDSGRDWRTGERLEKEGFKGFREKFGPKAFTLNHRFYLHYDWGNHMWLSAEDGCEGTPAVAKASVFSKLFG